VPLPIGNHQLYITWLDPKTFATRAVYDYAPGGEHPESAGPITVVKGGKDP
jgi:hypothetical protein